MTPFGIAILIFGLLIGIAMIGLVAMTFFTKTKGGDPAGKSAMPVWAASIAETLKTFDPKVVANHWITLAVLSAVVVAYFISLITVRWDFETPSNISNKMSAAASSYGSYALMPRNSMAVTLKNLNTVPQEQLVLTNFFISTANMAGLCFTKTNSTGTRAIYTSDAIRLSLLGGARAFVFDCWPSTEGGQYQHGPILQTVEPGSMWRRTSFNSVPLATPLATLMTQAFNSNYDSTSNDLIIIYLRFRTPGGKTPRSDTMNLAAKVLQSTIQPYRLDAAFNRCRAQDQIALLPLASFAGKVLVVCNFNGAGTALADYINVWHGEDDLHTALDHDTGFAANIPPTNVDSSIRQIKQQLTFVAPYGEDPVAESNSWNIAAAQNLSVHCCGINMDPGKVPPALKKMFEKNSFSLKPDAAATTAAKPATENESFVGEIEGYSGNESLRYAPQHLAEPQMPPKKFTAMGSGPSPGSIKTPPAIGFPGM